MRPVKTQTDAARRVRHVSDRAPMPRQAGLRPSLRGTSHPGKGPKLEKLDSVDQHAAAPRSDASVSLPVAFGLLLLVGATTAVAAQQDGDLKNIFAIDGAASILDEEHLGIVNGRLTVGVPFKDVARIDGLWAPPYVSSDFRLTATVLGQGVPTKHYVWRPFKVERKGTVGAISVSTATVLLPGKRAGVLAITLENTAAQPQEVPVRFDVRGTLDRSEAWEFAAPQSRTATTPAVGANTMTLRQRDLAIVLRSGPGVVWDGSNGCGRASVSLKPGGRATIDVAMAVGTEPEAVAVCGQVIAGPQEAIREAEEDHLRRVRDLFDRLPRLASNNASLVRLYERSLVHLLMNRWEVPEFVLHPYYATGSVKGGCVCNYLWNFGEVWEILPLLDPAATRQHVKQFLKTDLTRHFAFNPIGGRAFGPWYMVNQEKIIGLIYYYVRTTGDAAFLQEVVDGRTILQHAVANALFGDDRSRPVALIDYGESNSHLELRRGHPYNHVMPDLNGRRYANYLRAAELADLSGQPEAYLRERAEALKTLLKREMWNPQTRWFDFRDGRGRKDTRYTIQMFKLFGSGVLDAEEDAGLLGHLNQREFLSEFGLHSMSKTDAAYDAVDIDNGGGGSCTCFPPQIAERLYQAGHAQAAEDLLGRILWWGRRMPYWGDSLVADRIDYRRDTPLQCTIDGAAVAQCVLFGMFGVDPRLDGSIAICPHPPAFAPQIALRGLKLRGTAIDIDVSDGRFEVKTAGRAVRAAVGETVIVRRDGAPMRTLPSGPRTTPAPGGG
jgi:hypothetical protein